MEADTNEQLPASTAPQASLHEYVATPMQLVPEPWEERLSSSRPAESPEPAVSIVSQAGSPMFDTGVVGYACPRLDGWAIKQL